MDIRFASTSRDDAQFAACWDQHVAPRSLTLDRPYLALLEHTDVHRESMFLLGKDAHGRVIAAAGLTVSVFRLANVWPLRTVLLGGPKTAGKAFWFDESAISYEHFCRALMRYLRRSVRHDLIVWKDFVEGVDTKLLAAHRRLGFTNLPSLVSARLDLEGISSFEGFLRRLNAKKRHHLRRMESQSRRDGLQVHVQASMSGLVDTLYPLYLDVNARASESRTPPLPRSYFERFAGFSGGYQVLTLSLQERTIGFGLLLESASSTKCLSLGMNTALSKRYNLWYVLVLESIKHAVARGHTCVDLGSTNFAMKRKFGARREDVWVSIRHKDRHVHALVAPLIRRAFSAMYTPEREAATQESAQE